MGPQPAIGGFAITLEQFVEPAVKGGAVVHMADMRDFVRDHRPADKGRGHDQPPAERNRSTRRTAAPPAARIAYRKRGRGFACLAAISGNVFRKDRARLFAQPAQDSLADQILGAAEMQLESRFAVDTTHPAAVGSAPDDAMRLADEGDLRAVPDLHGCRGGFEPCGDPLPFLRHEIERGCGWGINRHGNADFTPDRVRAQRDSPGLCCPFDPDRYLLPLDIDDRIPGLGVREAVRQYGFQAVQHGVRILPDL